MVDEGPLLTKLLSQIDNIRVIDLGSRPTPNNSPIYQNMLDHDLCEIMSIDVDADCYDEEQKNTKYLQRYIADGHEHIFYECELKTKSSLFEPNFACTDLFQTLSFGAKIQSEKTVQTTRLDDIGHIGRVDWLCMDIQGSELMALENGKKTLENVSVVHTEVEFVEQYKEQPLFADIDCELRSQGFMFHSFLGFGSKSWRPVIIENDIMRGKNQWLWADAVYIRHPEKWKELKANTLLKMALIMDMSYGSWDLSYSLFKMADGKLESNFASLYMDYLKLGNR